MPHHETRHINPLCCAAVFFLAVLVFASPCLAQDLPRVRPPEWARPIIDTKVENFFKVDDRVYRSAQPDAPGMKEVESMGIKNVLSLKHYFGDEDEAEGTQLKLFRVKMEASEIRDEDVIRALRIIRESEGPILVHCWYGSDRTGCIIALYRIIEQDWSKEQAIDEMMHGGYGFHTRYDNIPQYIEGADIEKIRERLAAP
ncbi:MAG: tyrosine-protein phosphatase [Syntrophaceae bacterium]|nr:tyrosine-protein phosphatase [Deltaproteobacteria bacterium]